MAGPAAIYSIAGDARAESEAWARFASARDGSEFCASWLALLCSQIHRINGALLLIGPEHDGSYRAAAVWPDAGRSMQHLTPAAEKALNERRGIVLGSDGVSMPGRGEAALVGYPVEVSGVLRAAVALDLAAGPEPALQHALRMIHWASAWLVDQFRQQDVKERDERLARLTLAMDLVASALQESRFTAAALAVANELAARLRCDRVSVGVERAGRVEVRAISHNSNFDARTSLVRLIGAAMDEVLDLDSAIVLPAADDLDDPGAVAHVDLAREFKDIAVCSVPLSQDGAANGVLTLERCVGEPFDAATVEVCKTVGMLLGPLLALQRDNERGPLDRLQSSVADGTRALFGPRHSGVKLVALTAAAAAVIFATATGEYRVPARTVIEGQVQRAAVAPFDGYVAQGLVRAGDTVAKGQVLARLDDRQLRLEQTKLDSEREQLTRKHRQALAAQDRAAMAVIAAQVSQAEAQLSLVDVKLARATLVAPFDGVVVSGDLSQLLGTPVEQGKVLFQVAPLDTYRVILEVDERDIAQVRVGQQGELALSGMPDRRLRFSLRQITPASTAQEGRNYFRVEARLDGAASASLRPGMEGIGKIAAGERKLIWIWTHPLIDWLRVSAWRWLP